MKYTLQEYRDAASDGRPSNVRCKVSCGSVVVNGIRCLPHHLHYMNGRYVVVPVPFSRVLSFDTSNIDGDFYKLNATAN
jgi:hypothetical protein